MRTQEFPWRGSLWALATLSLVAFGASPPAAHAQYFGHNRVQYEKFDFELLKTEHFDLYYYPQEYEAVLRAAVMAERWYARLAQFFNHQLRGRQPIIVYASAPHFQQTNALPGAPGEGTGGVTEVFKRRIVLPFAGPLAETDHVLGHELIHAFQFDMTGAVGPVSANRVPSALRMPLWFIEGMAEYLSVGPIDPHTAMWMRDATRRELPTIRQLNDPRFFPYRYGHALWAYIAGRWGDQAVAEVLRSAARTADVGLAFQKVLGLSADSLSKEWHAALRDAYEPIAERTRAPEDYGRQVLRPGEGGRLHVAPALSPDGRWLVFFSERDLFSVDLFLADVESGEVKKKIVKTAVDPHFESLLFINSSGAWGPDGRRVAFGAIRKGKPVLALLDVERGKVTREISFPQLGEILNPSWSPDGRQIAFSAIAGGFSDLYLYDLEAGELARLTNDEFADLQPAWSPDGRRIAFVTDRFSSDPARMRFGGYQLSLLDVATRQFRAVPGFSNAKNINPQWSPDGRSLYFLSDANGITNVYRLEPESGERFQVTQLYTGVSGITALSPALSVAQRTGRLVFSAYEKGEYILYAVDDAVALRGESPAAPLARVPPAVLPPQDRPERAPVAAEPQVEAVAQFAPAVLPPQQRPEGAVLAYLRDPVTGLPEPEGFEAKNYRAGLSLDYIGQPFLAVGADRFGTYVSGGTALFWSDMLGNHNLATMLQVSGDIESLPALFAYT